MPAGANVADFWTARYIDGFIVWVCRGRDGLGSYLAVLEVATWSMTSIYKVSSLVSVDALTPSSPFADSLGTHARLTRWTLPTGRTILAGWAGGEWFLVSFRFDGVIRYADFSESSCAAAARDLGVVVNAIVDVSAFRTLSLRGRLGLGSGDSVADIGTPIEEIERPLSDFYRASVSVTVNSSADEPDVVAGDTGDSARRLELSSDLVTTPGMAVAAAVSTFQFCSRIRAQRDVTIGDTGRAVFPFQRVTLRGKEWVVYKVETDLAENESDLVLLEAD
jgi:hypothetical protein